MGLAAGVRKARLPWLRDVFYAGSKHGGEPEAIKSDGYGLEF